MNSADAGNDVQIAGKQTRQLLFIGFGGLLVLLAFTGLNAVSVLSTIRVRNERIRQDYVNRQRILEQLRSDIYLSGTYVRDLLLEPISERADAHRRELDATHIEIQSLIGAYKAILRGDERRPFGQFTGEVASYFDSLHPALNGIAISAANSDMPSCVIPFCLDAW